MKKTISVLLAILLCSGALVSGAWAQEFGLGDRGKPPDYDKTISLWADKVTDLAAVAASYPAEFSWMTLKKVTPAKNQGTCGSCWAFASCGTLESKIMIKGGPELNLSEQQQVSCNVSMAGCCGGGMEALKFWTNDGPLAEVDACGKSKYAELKTSCPKKWTVECKDLAGCKRLSFFLKDWHTVETKAIDEVKTSIYIDGPTYFRYDVYKDFRDFWKNEPQDAVYHQKKGDSRESSEYLGGHAVLIIGWSDKKKAWLCKNSWGTSGKRKDGLFWIGWSGHKADLNFGMANVKLVLKGN